MLQRDDERVRLREGLRAWMRVMREGFRGRGRWPWHSPPIYTQSHTFCGGNGCIPVSAAALKGLIRL